MDNDFAMDGNAFCLRRNVLALIPLFSLLTIVFLLFGGEADVATAFRHIRAEFATTDAVVRWLSKYGNIPFYLAYAYLLLRRREAGGISGRRYALHYVVFLLLLLLTTDTLKIWIGRPRPGEAGEYMFLSLEKAWHSFPSNHMTETTFTVLSLAHFHKRGFLTVGGGVWMAVMGFSRLFLGRHHPSDLLGSALLGCVAVYLLWKAAGPAPAPAPALSLGDGALAQRHTLTS